MLNQLSLSLALPSLVIVSSSLAFADGNVCAQKYGSQVCVGQGVDIILKQGPQSFRTCFVQAISADGSMSCYFRDNYSTEAMNLNSADVVTNLGSLGGIQQGTEIIVRDAKDTYTPYYVSSIYSDGTFVLYNRSTYASSFVTQDELMKKYVTQSSQMNMTIATYRGQQETSIKQGSDITLRMGAGTYTAFYVSSIYSDDVVALYNRSNYTTSYHSKSELSKVLVLSLPSAPPFAQGQDATIRDQAKTYQNYYVTAIYSDGIVVLYNRSTYQTSYRTLVELTQDDVTSVSSVDVPIKTVNGSKMSSVRQGSDIILKLNEGNYVSYYVSVIYSDQELALYNRSTYQTSFFSKDELSPLLVENLQSLSGLQQGSEFALAAPGSDPLARNDYYVSVIYSDGIAALYSRFDFKTSYMAASSVASSGMIRILDQIDPFKAEGIYTVRDKAGNQQMILALRFYSDQVLRYVVLNDSMSDLDLSKSRLAKVADFSIVKTECDPSSGNACRVWWYQNLQKRKAGNAN